LVDKVAHLRWSLSETAAQLLWGTEDLTYAELTEKLRSRFGGKGMEEKYQTELRCRRRARGESLRELSQDVQRLMALAYPGEKSSLSEHIARDAFLSALDDPDFELKVREREPIDLDAAVKLAQRFEVFKSTVESSSHTRHRVNRQVVDDEERVLTTNDLQTRVANVEKQLQEVRTPPKTNGNQQLPVTRPDEMQFSVGSTPGKRNRRNRAVNNDTNQWKDEMNKKIQELQIAQQVAEGQSQRLAAENDALNKEVGRLRHLEQTRSTPTWMTTVASSPAS